MDAHIVQPSSSDQRAPWSALVVEPTLADQVVAISALSMGGFQVTVADNFRVARAFLDECSPTLLLTEIRLKEYNGLHLVLRAKAAHPSMAAVVTTTWTDAVLQAEAESMGATFVAKPFIRPELLAAVLRTLYRSGDDLAGPIRPPFERRSLERRTLLDPAFNPDRRASLGRRRDDKVVSIETAGVG